MCTHAAECSLAGSQPAEGSGNSPSPPWALSPPALCRPAVRPGPFPPLSPPPAQAQAQAGRTDSAVGGADSSPGLTSSSESYSPA